MGGGLAIALRRHETHNGIHAITSWFTLPSIHTAFLATKCFPHPTFPRPCHPPRFPLGLFRYPGVLGGGRGFRVVGRWLFPGTRSRGKGEGT